MSSVPENSAKPIGAPTGPRPDYKPEPPAYRRDAGPLKPSAFSQAAQSASPDLSSAKSTPQASHSKSPAAPSPSPASTSVNPAFRKPLESSISYDQAKQFTLQRLVKDSHNYRLVQALEPGLNAVVELAGSRTGLNRKQITQSCRYLADKGFCRYEDLPGQLSKAIGIDVTAIAALFHALLPDQSEPVKSAGAQSSATRGAANQPTSPSSSSGPVSPEPTRPADTAKTSEVHPPAPAEKTTPSANERIASAVAAVRNRPTERLNDAAKPTLEPLHPGKKTAHRRPPAAQSTHNQPSNHLPGQPSALDQEPTALATSQSTLTFNAAAEIDQLVYLAKRMQADMQHLITRLALVKEQLSIGHQAQQKLQALQDSVKNLTGQKLVL